MTTYLPWRIAGLFQRSANDSKKLLSGGNIGLSVRSVAYASILGHVMLFRSLDQSRTTRPIVLRHTNVPTTCECRTDRSLADSSQNSWAIAVCARAKRSRFANADGPFAADVLSIALLGHLATDYGSATQPNPSGRPEEKSKGWPLEASNRC